MKRFHFTAAAVSVACALTACGGGGGNDDTPRVGITAVKVAGASLADSGTFGYKFTVQPSSSVQLYTERIASAYGLPALCNVFTFASSTFSLNTSKTGCTNYAVAGASVGNYSLTAHAYLPPSSPTSMLMQLGTMASQAGTAFKSTDLILVGEGPANDIATVVSAYLSFVAFAQSNGAIGSTTDFTNLMSSSGGQTILGLDAGTIGTKLADTTGAGQYYLANLYMQRVATLLAASIKTNLLDKGAQRVAVLNLLDVTYTPKLQAVLAANASSAATIRSAVRAWTATFNTQLATEVAALNTSKVVIVDFNTNFTAEMTDPAQYGLTNVSATVCDEIVNASATTTTVATAGTTSLSTVVSNVPTVAVACTTSAASALTPKHDAVNGTNWWKTYLFADNFHPTPYGHQLLGQLVAKRLTEAGWL